MARGDHAGRGQDRPAWRSGRGGPLPAPRRGASGDVGAVLPLPGPDRPGRRRRPPLPNRPRPHQLPARPQRRPPVRTPDPGGLSPLRDCSAPVNAPGTSWVAIPTTGQGDPAPAPPNDAPTDTPPAVTNPPAAEQPTPSRCTAASTQPARVLTE